MTDLAGPFDESSYPTDVNWIDAGAVTPVKNQGPCGSSWAFSTTGSLEGAHFVATGNLVSFSEQQLVDCSFEYGNRGCSGGRQEYGYHYYEAGHYAMTEEVYPYTSGNGSTTSDCKYDASSATDVTVLYNTYIDIFNVSR